MCAEEKQPFWGRALKLPFFRVYSLIRNFAYGPKAPGDPAGPAHTRSPVSRTSSFLTVSSVTLGPSFSLLVWHRELPCLRTLAGSHPCLTPKAFSRDSSLLCAQIFLPQIPSSHLISFFFFFLVVHSSFIFPH